jgi:cytochrome c oxidase cbb3-type subunit 2
VHLNNPRDVVPESNMPGFPWLSTTLIDESDTAAKMKTMKALGVPYTDEEIAKGADEVKGKTEQDALIAYLQNLGTVVKTQR